MWANLRDSLHEFSQAFCGCGCPLDLPTIFQKIHIVPWKAAYPPIFGAHDPFVLSTSGHTAGVINPPKAEKYSD
jgi:hypothetical protein